MLDHISHASHYLKPLRSGYTRGSLSNHLAARLGREVAARPSSRQIFGGLRMGAGCLPFAGVSGSSNAPDGLFAVESAPTRFYFSMNRVATPAKAVMARLVFLSNQTERATHA